MHNIEINNGVASYAENGLRERAWHRLGQVFDRPMTVTEALEASHADFGVSLQDIILVTPEMKTMMENATVPTDLLLDCVIHGRKATMREDKETALGIVSDSYGIVQNRDAFAFIDTLCSGKITDHAPVIESAGVLGRGERIFITAKFPDDIILDNRGDDRVEMYIVFTTSHDGTGSVKCMVTPTRVVCNNTLNFAMEHNKGCLSLRHSSNIMSRLDLTSKENTEFAFKALNLLDVYKKSLEDKFKQLSCINLTEADVDNAIARLLLEKEDFGKYKTVGFDGLDVSSRIKSTFEDIKSSVEGGIGQDYGKRGTGLWLVNGITSYFQNVSSYRTDEGKFNSILGGRVRQKISDTYYYITHDIRL